MSGLGLAAHSLTKHRGKGFFPSCACAEFGHEAVAVANPALPTGVFQGGSDAAVCSVPAGREQPRLGMGNASSGGAGVSAASPEFLAAAGAPAAAAATRFLMCPLLTELSQRDRL